MLGEPNPNISKAKGLMKINFVKMSGIGNDFIIIDERNNSISLTTEQIKKISNRKNIGCDQLIKINNCDEADCKMEIFNPDGSKSGACGNATRCVAALLIKPSTKLVTIKTAARILSCWRKDNLISVNMGQPKFKKNVSLYGFDFFCVDVGNPHAVTFLNKEISDKKFFEIGPKIENNKFFPNKTNVEFAQIISDDLIKVRVWERGAGETLACGSGACATAILAIKQNLVKSKKVTIRFKGGNLLIEQKNKSIIMTGEYTKIFEGTINENFLA